MAEGLLTSPPDFELPNNDSTPYYFLFRCSHRGQVLPSKFISLLNHHQKNVIVLRYGIRSWPVTVNNSSFQDGWDEYCRDNIVKTHDILMLRHTGGLIFDVLHFCELQQQVYLPWTVPLPSLLQNAAYHQQGQCISQLSILTLTDHYQKIPKFTDHFLNGVKTPSILIKTGHNITEIGVKGNRLKKNWRSFVLQHQLQHNEVLVFVPES